MSNKEFAKVALIKNDYELVINKGTLDRVRVGDELTIYRIGQEIKDPDTDVSLGFLENVLAKVMVTHVQEMMATAISNDYDRLPNKSETKKVVKNNMAGVWGAIASLGPSEVTTVTPGEVKRKRLSAVKIGDLVAKET